MKRSSIFNPKPITLALIGGLLAVAGCSQAANETSATKPAPVAAAGGQQALKLELPLPTLKGTPEDLPQGPNIEPATDKPPVSFENSQGLTKFMVPGGVKNVASGKKVTSSVPPFTGELSQVTDGQKEAYDDQAVEMKKGSQWVQVDLEKEYPIAAIVVWHDHRYVQLFRDVIIAVSNDPEFKTGVVILYNNDTDNSSGLGLGTDKEYFETRYGRIIDGKSTKARYVRSYSKGGNQSAINTIQEIEVYAPPAK
jgi:hypothetical protein